MLFFIKLILFFLLWLSNYTYLKWGLILYSIISIIFSVYVQNNLSISDNIYLQIIGRTVEFSGDISEKMSRIIVIRPIISIFNIIYNTLQSIENKIQKYTTEKMINLIGKITTKILLSNPQNIMPLIKHKHFSQPQPLPQQQSLQLPQNQNIISDLNNFKDVKDVKEIKITHDICIQILELLVEMDSSNEQTIRNRLTNIKQKFMSQINKHLNNTDDDSNIKSGTKSGTKSDKKTNKKTNKSLLNLIKTSN